MSRHQTGLIRPTPDLDSSKWWSAVAERRFVLPRCTTCNSTFFPPMPTCPRCASPTVDLCDASGRGRVYSWIVVHRTLDPDFHDDVPYTIVTVDFDDGARMAGRLCGGNPQPGAAVAVEFYEVDGQVLIGFRPSGG